MLSISPNTAGRDAASVPTSASADRPETSSPAPGDTVLTARWLQTFLALALAVTITAAVLSASALAVAHARDRYWINIASGSWLALAWSANHSELYPPLRDAAGNFAGTRYMPLCILAHAALARATGEYIFSGKIIACVSAFAWLMGICVLARQRGSPRLFAGAMAASVLLSPVGFQALCTVRSDSLALALQLWALWAGGRVAREGRVSWAVLAGALCALAFLAKLTAVWAALAIGLWLLWRNRAAFAAFVASAIVIAGAALALLHMVTDGRMLESLLGAGASGWQGWGSVLLWSQRRMLMFVSEWSPTTWVLAPAAALAVLLALARRDLQLVHIAWIICCGTLGVMFADVGVGENHIIELAAMTAVLAGDLWSRAAGDSLGAESSIVNRQSSMPWTVAQMLLAISLAWSSLAVLKQRLWTDLNDALAALRTSETPPRHDPRAFDAILSGKSFLSDDPSLAILLNRKPVVSDAFVFRGLHSAHPEWTAELMDRINRREFDAVVLLQEADPQSWWYTELFLGRPVVEAIVANYRFDRQVGEHRVYVKKDA